MSILVDYPGASLKKSLELAQAVDALGGNSSIDMCAHKLEKKVSGGFREILRSAVKFGFIISKNGNLTTTPFFKDIGLAYNQTQKKCLMQQAFLNVPLFRRVCERFNGQKLPVEFFDKLLIKEFAVGVKQARRVKSFFINGAKDVELMTPDATITLGNEKHNETVSDSPADPDKNSANISTTPANTSTPKQKKLDVSEDTYVVNIYGPGMNSSISITETDDIAIVDIMLKKIEKMLKAKKEDEDLDL